MARGRMISNSISTSTKLMAVDNFAKLLFTWMIPHCDDLGHLDANPKVIKGLVVPLCDETIEDVATALRSLTKADLIVMYEIEGREYLEICKWDNHQTLRIDAGITTKYPKRSQSNRTSIAQQSQIGRKSIANASQSHPSALSLGSISFSSFWEMYPRKKDKRKAMAKWDRLDPETQNKILIDIPNRLKNDYQWKRGFITYPTTYLHGERWEDEIQKEGPESTAPVIRKTLKA